MALLIQLYVGLNVFLLLLTVSMAGINSVAIATTGHQALEALQSQLDEMVGSNGAEIQQLAACRISSKDLLATAESTARGILQGVCNPREMEDRLHNLQSQMADQFNVIKTMLLNIEDKLGRQDVEYRRANRQLHGAVAELGESIQSCSNRSPGAATPGTGNSSTGNTASVGTSISANDTAESWNPREEEIEQFNSTIHTENGRRVFTYYWQIYDMEYKLTSWGLRRSLRSPSFYIFTYGYMMYLRIYPRQSGQNVYIHVGLTKGEYDEALEWPFTLKHRITVLDQSPPPYQDIVSRVWDPQVLCSAWNWKRPTSGDNYECVGLGFPHEDLKSRGYIRDDVLIVKLTVYLD